ncbi:MAG TPA: hypothetical protein VK186_09390 [Candidatus Deferrimicrobium sp.]|nr:hypothetical protein [Candidatus Deferrimicrobium sp.]
MKITDRVLLIGLLVIAIGVGIFHVFIVPPFQNPDEVQHFLYSASYAYGKEEMVQVEQRVLELLKVHKWFHFVGIGPGWEKTKQISDIPFVFHFNLDKQSTRKTAFHFAYGMLLKLTRVKDVLAAFYLMRFFSTLIYTGILVLVFFFFRKQFPRRWEYLFAGILVVFQLGTILNAVNYDVFMVLWGTLFFIYSFHYLYFGKKLDLVLLMVFTAAAILTKLVGFMFLIYLLILISIRLRWRIKINKQWVQHSVLTLLFFIIAVCWLNYLFPGRFFSLYSQVFRVMEDLNTSMTVYSGKVIQVSFFNSITDSFYFYIGWMGYKLSTIWYFVLKLFLFISFIGYILLVVSKKAREMFIEKKWLLFTAIAFILQVFSVWMYYGHLPISQGRYLYPLIVPIIFLVYSGLEVVENWFGMRKHYIQTAYILFQVVLWIFAVVRIISVFYLEIASPHPGL